MPDTWALTPKGHSFVEDYDENYDRETELKGLPSRNYFILDSLVAGPKEISEIDFSIPVYTKIPATTLRQKLRELESKNFIEKW